MHIRAQIKATAKKLLGREIKTLNVEINKRTRWTNDESWTANVADTKTSEIWMRFAGAGDRIVSYRIYRNNDQSIRVWLSKDGTRKREEIRKGKETTKKWYNKTGKLLTRKVTYTPDKIVDQRYDRLGHFEHREVIPFNQIRRMHASRVASSDVACG